ncbi:unnamed protein product [Urochloa humidicola]
MHGLRHKKLTSKGATRGGSNQTGFSDDVVQSNRSKGAHVGSSERSIAVQSNRNKEAHARSSDRSIAVQSNRSSERTIAHSHRSKRVLNNRGAGAHTGEDANCTMVGADGEHSERNSANGASHGVNSQLNGATDGVNSQLNGVADGVNSQVNGSSNGVSSQLNGSSDGVNSQQNGSKRVLVDAPKRGRAKMSRTELKMAPRSGRVELVPKGHRQFKYVVYNPKGLKYPSQVGAILKREYPGIIKVYDEQGNVVRQHPALSWNDYYWKKNRDGICYARRVKQEFWKIFSVHRNHRLLADKVLEAYLVRRVSNMIYQLRLEAVKVYFHKRGEKCDDTRARTIELTEEQYLTCRLEWCNKASWAWFSKYWTTDDYKKKRKIAQDCCMGNEDNAQNRGGSRNFTETQQLLEHTFGPEKSGTLNTYAVMKSGYKTVDSTGRAGPIPSQKAQKRVDDYRELVSDENSQEFDGKALHIVGNGMKHGRVPIGDGAVDKAIVLVHSKSVAMKPINPADYDRVVKENEQLKETNGILYEENSINRSLIMEMYSDLGKEPSAALLRRLESIDARRRQAAGSPQGCSHSVDDRHNDENMEERDDDDNSHGSEEDSDGDTADEQLDQERGADDNEVGEGDC